jgi:hypothetical protein
MQHRDLGDGPAQLNLGLAQEIVAEQFPVFVPSGLFDGGHVLAALWFVDHGNRGLGVSAEAVEFEVPDWVG